MRRSLRRCVSERKNNSNNNDYYNNNEEAMELGPALSPTKQELSKGKKTIGDLQAQAKQHGQDYKGYLEKTVLGQEQANNKDHHLTRSKSSAETASDHQESMSFASDDKMTRDIMEKIIASFSSHLKHPKRSYSWIAAQH